MTLRPLSVPLLSAFLGACVTINVYFPAAAAQAAADRVIDEVWGGQAGPRPAPVQPAAPPEIREPTSSLEQSSAREVAVMLIDFVVPAAQAGSEPDLDVSSPEIQRLTDSMESRFPDLSPYYESGAVGVVSDGYIVVRDPNLVPLPERNKVRNSVANENADRAALYHEIAAANGKPEWEAQIRAVFGKRWVARAKAGWMVHDGTGWKKK
jgi:uncharacterized protein YdbL (DUF1318 family)